MYICECCGKEFEEDYRKDKKLRKTIPRFCSRTCANKRKHSLETKQKISNSIKFSEKAIKAREKNIINFKTSSKNWKKHILVPRILKVCPVCNKEFQTTEIRNKKYCRKREY